MDGEGTSSPQATGAAMLDAANNDNASTTNTSGVNTPVADNTPPAAPVQNSGSGHPAWNQYLKDIPEGFHPVVTPAFEKWDKEVQRQLQQVQSQYAPYRDIIQSGVQPQQLGEALRLYQMMAQDPQQIYNAMAEHYGFGGNADQGQADETEEDEFELGVDNSDISNHPQFKQLMQQQQALQAQQEQFIAAMQNAQQAREAEAEQVEADQWLEQRIGATTETLKQKGIEPDWDYIVTRTIALKEAGQAQNNDQAWDMAVQSWVDKVDSWNKQRPATNAPLVIPTNGGTPSNQLPDLSSGKDRRSIGAAMLDAAFRNG